MTRTQLTRRLTLGTIVAGAVAAAAVASAPDALATTGHAIPHLSATQQHAAMSAASSPGARALVATATRSAAQRRHIAVPHSPAKIGSNGTPVFALSADFVRERSDTAGRLWYVATPVSTGAGAMTLFTARDKAGDWQAVNVATGNTEATMAAAAHGASLLVEPQVDAWYAVAHDRVRPLNKAARQVVGKGSISVDAYQHIVHARYADKQAGSRYAERGTAGGFSASAVEPGRASHGGMTSDAAGFAAAGALVLGAAGVGLKRRRRV